MFSPLSVSRSQKSYGRIWTKLGGQVGCETRTRRFHFGSGLDANSAYRWETKCKLFSLTEVYALPRAVLVHAVVDVIDTINEYFTARPLSMQNMHIYLFIVVVSLLELESRLKLANNCLVK